MIVEFVVLLETDAFSFWPIVIC